MEEQVIRTAQQGALVLPRPQLPIRQMVQVMEVVDHLVLEEVEESKIRMFLILPPEVVVQAGAAMDPLVSLLLTPAQEV